MPSDPKALDEIRDSWEAFGREDPLWAVLTVPGLRGGGWDPAEFLATGEREIADVLDLIADLGLKPDHGRALDFGCGAGRLTRALAGRFESVVGVDVAEAMLVAARRLNADLVNVSWIHNTRLDLSIIPAGSIDFIYCNLVLQHMPPDLSLVYVGEFGRVLANGGIAVFQVPLAHPGRLGQGQSRWRRIVRRARRRLSRVTRGRGRAAPPSQAGSVPPHRPRMLYHGVPQRTIRGVVARSGGTVVAEVDKSTSVGWPGILYVIRRP